MQVCRGGVRAQQQVKGNTQNHQHAITMQVIVVFPPVAAGP